MAASSRSYNRSGWTKVVLDPFNRDAWSRHVGNTEPPVNIDGGFFHVCGCVGLGQFAYQERDLDYLFLYEVAGRKIGIIDHDKTCTSFGYAISPGITGSVCVECVGPRVMVHYARSLVPCPGTTIQCGALSGHHTVTGLGATPSTLSRTLVARCMSLGIAWL